MNKVPLLAALLSSLIFHSAQTAAAENSGDPAEVTVGERLFLETRFAQAYYANPGKADPVMSKTILTTSSVDSPFAGKTMNCRACHMVDEHAKNPLAGMRSYADYTKRPPVPKRKDGAKTSGRNAMSMVNISRPHQSQSSATFHYDGQFNSIEDLVRGTFTGRNFGWLASESKTAIKHIAKIIREDNGKGELAQEFGGAYSTLLKGTDKKIKDEFRLPKDYRIDVTTASDKQILDAVAKLVSAYVTDLNFQMDSSGQYTGSPYDAFLALNKLPRKTSKNETNQQYSLRLLKAVNNLKSPRFVKADSYEFASHSQAYVFSETELKGMKLFFSKGNNKTKGGNCISCHAAPHFSDFGFHNTGLVQHNYDALHGAGKFNKLLIPALAKRNKNYNAFLPATAEHPNAHSRFRSITVKNKPGYTDLGLWNVFANPDMPNPQKKLTTIMCNQLAKKTQCNQSALLNSTIAAFKTPVLRDLGHSAPFMHTGQFADLPQVVRFYITSSLLAKNKSLRNSDKALQAINISESDVTPLVAFIKSLNEDYD